jgi:glucans biosynthesis protein C
MNRRDAQRRPAARLSPQAGSDGPRRAAAPTQRCGNVQRDARGSISTRRTSASAEGAAVVGGAPKLPPSAHRPALDWLRSFVVFWLIPFHAARIYDVWHPYYVKGAQLSLGLSLVFGFFAAWGMELLFVVAGQASAYALSQHGPRRYRGERLRRLGLPMLVGMLVLVPAMAYLGQIWHTGVADSWLGFYAQFWHFWAPGDPYGGGFTLGHLWFIVYLFGFALVSAPIVRVLQGGAGRRACNALMPVLTRPGGLLLLAAPVALTALIPWPGARSPLYYLTLYGLGLGLALDERSNAGIDRSLLPALILGVALTPLSFTAPLQSGLAPLGLVVRDLAAAGLAVASWCWVIVALGLARRYVSQEHRLLRYTREATLPYYILHEPVVVALGLAVVRRNLGLWPGFVLITLGALVITLGLYELLIRRLPALRFLFGMRPLPARA